MVAVFRNGGIIVAISPFLLVVLLLPSKSFFSRDVPWLGKRSTYIRIIVVFCTVGPLLFGQRVSPLRLVRINDAFPWLTKARDIMCALESRFALPLCKTPSEPHRLR